MDDDNEKKALIEYMGRATAFLGEIKSLSWRFLVANVATASFIILNLDKTIGSEGVILFSFAVMCLSAIFISVHSFVKLKQRRIELREVYAELKFLDKVRPDYKDQTTRYDCGDVFFLFIGTAAPLLLFVVVYKIMASKALSAFPVSPDARIFTFGFWNVAGVCLIILGLALITARIVACKTETQYEDSLRRNRSAPS